MKKVLGWPLLISVLLLAVGGWGEGRPARALPEPHLGYGVNVRDIDHLETLVAPLGFDWVKLWEEYTSLDELPTEPLPYHVHYIFSCEGYIFGDLEAWGDHVEELAEAGRGRIDSYEVCNEPNLSWLWEGKPPDPARYVQMLCVAYERIKAVDPEAMVVSGGLAPTGRIQGTCEGESSGEVWDGNNCQAMDERTYLAEMLEHGAGPCMDAFGYHPCGFAYPPETDPDEVENGFAFRAAEVMHRILEEHGVHIPVWATEFNWVRDPSEDGRSYCHGEPGYEGLFGWMDVSEEQQADYLVRAFRYADENWPWMQGMFVWNLDWHNYNWPCEPSRYFSIRRDDGTDLGAPTQAYDALVAMEKRPAPFLALDPTRLQWLVDVDELAVITAAVAIDNIGHYTFTWTATVDPAGEITPTLPVTRGVQGESLWVVVDPSGWTTGTYTGGITVAAVPTTTLNAPQRVELTLLVVPEVQRLYLPLVLRR